MGKKVFSRLLRWLPGIVISLIAIFLLAKYISVEDLLQAARAFTVKDILFICLLNILSFIARGLGWKNLLEGVSFKQAFLIVNEGYLFNNLIPRSGEIVRTLLVGGVTGIGAFQAVSSVLVERALDIIIAATMFLLTLPLAVEMEWIKPFALVLFFGFLCMLVILVVLAERSDQVKSKMANSKIKSELVRERVFPKIVSILDGLVVLRKPKEFLKSLLWILLSWVCWTSLIFFGITRLSNSVPLWQAVFAQGMLALGIALPSAPAGLGVYEGTMVAALSVFGIDQSSSLSLALVLHFSQILITAAIGIYGLIIQGQSISKLINRIWGGNSKTEDQTTGAL